MAVTRFVLKLGHEDEYIISVLAFSALFWKSKTANL